MLSFLPFLLYSQYSQEQIIKDVINHLNTLSASSKNEEKKIIPLSNVLLDMQIKFPVKVKLHFVLIVKFF